MAGIVTKNGADIITEARVLVGRQEVVLGRVVGDGNGGPERSTGIQTASQHLILPPGTHAITLGGFNNKKTWFNESTDVLFDDILITGSGAENLTAGVPVEPDEV